MTFTTKRVHLEISEKKLEQLTERAKWNGFDNVNEFLQDLLYCAVQSELETEYVIWTARPKA